MLNYQKVPQKFTDVFNDFPWFSMIEMPFWFLYRIDPYSPFPFSDIRMIGHIPRW